jgi:hypothetical protein
VTDSLVSTHDEVAQTTTSRSDGPHAYGTDDLTLGPLPDVETRRTPIVSILVGTVGLVDLAAALFTLAAG